MFSWFKCDCDKQSEINAKIQEVDAKLLALEKAEIMAERKANIIDSVLLHNPKDEWTVPSSYFKRMHATIFKTNAIEIHTFDGKESILLGKYGAETLRDFLLKHYPLQEDKNNGNRQ